MLVFTWVHLVHTLACTMHMAHLNLTYVCYAVEWYWDDCEVLATTLFHDMYAVHRFHFEMHQKFSSLQPFVESVCQLLSKRYHTLLFPNALNKIEYEIRCEKENHLLQSTKVELNTGNKAINLIIIEWMEPKTPIKQKIHFIYVQCSIRWGPNSLHNNQPTTHYLLLLLLIYFHDFSPRRWTGSINASLNKT